MWHDIEIEPTSAGVSHSATAEVEVTMVTYGIVSYWCTLYSCWSVTLLLTRAA